MPERPTNVIDVMPVGVWEGFIPILREADEKPEVFVRSLTFLFDFAWRKEVEDQNFPLQTLLVLTQCFSIYFSRQYLQSYCKKFSTVVVTNKEYFGTFISGLKVTSG